MFNGIIPSPNLKLNYSISNVLILNSVIFDVTLFINNWFSISELKNPAAIILLENITI